MTSLLMEYADTRKMPVVVQFQHARYVSMLDRRFTPQQSDIIPFVRAVCLRNNRCYEGSIEALVSEVCRPCSLDDLDALQGAGLLDWVGDHDGRWLRVTWKGC